MMSKAGFNLRSWSSNNLEVRKLAKAQQVLDTDKYTKILGMRWNSETDELFYPQREIAFPKETTTKREILKHSLRIYDPLGFLNPVTVRAKLLLQELWKGQFEWDQPLPKDVSETWIEIARDIEDSTTLTFPRSYFQQNTSDQDTTLHVFVDASTKAYGAVAYICKGKETSIILARSRVAPLKELTLPQLELMAAVIGARLTHNLLPSMNCTDVTLWSDSKIVLHWLKSTKPLKRFVTNRVREILELTPGCQWKYCSTTVNPADLLTRGVSSDQLKSSKLWMNGPEFLRKPEMEIENSESQTNTTLSLLIEENDADEPDNLNESDNQNTQTGIHVIVDLNRYGSYSKLLHVTAYTLRFINNCRNNNEPRTTGPLKTEEIRKSTIMWLKNCQESVFMPELRALKLNDSSKKRLPRISQLRLFIDKDNLMRCEGRIHNAPLHESTKFAYLIPANHRLSELIVLDSHEQVLHSGVNTTVSFIRQNFWIPAIRQYMRKLLRKCIICRKVIGRSYPSTETAPLQKMRLQDSPPFTATGIDFTGALNIRNKDKSISKAYICLFTCASTRAIHLEVTTDLTEDSFIQAFRRFVSRKSIPKIIMSDNASTFVAASEHLKRLFESDKVQRELLNRGTEWRFIPKRAPWFGGFWERMIGLTKNCLKKVLGSSLVDLDTLQTFTTEVENILNDRPLTYISPDIDDNEPLTPAHLLYGRRISFMPYIQSIDFDANECYNMNRNDVSNRAKRQTLLIEHFWTRWRNEYLTSLREYHTKCGKSNINVKSGDLVQIEGDGPRIAWKTAMIEEVIRGNDGIPSSAVLRTSRGRTTRPLTGLYPLELSSEEMIASEDDVTHRRPVRGASVRARQKIKEWTKS